ncbi:MAG: T9SS type A sorting domain-containing protein [Bacteroidales bacterium]|nr:T9SS type A sorting domain-containing protein [Bacteroidales bacterium]
MKKLLLILVIGLQPVFSFASGILFESFEYANHDMTSPIGWTCDDQSWLCGHFDKDHNRTAHAGDWYAFTNADDSWMFMELFLSSQLKYRFSSWVISDGAYELEFWAGTEDNAEHMDQLLFTVTVDEGNYNKVSAYIETITADYPYFGIHAVASEGAYHLTIDEVSVDMVSKYDFQATPTTIQTSLYPGEQIVFRFDVQNLGYEPIDVIFSPSYEYFTDIHFTVEGTPCTVFHLEPDETKQVITEATLLPTVAVGSTCWLDIMLVLDCNCATSMTTLLVDVIESDGLAEFENENEALQVELFDLTGKKVDPSHLKAGIYIERTVSAQGVSTRKIVK